MRSEQAREYLERRVKDKTVTSASALEAVRIAEEEAGRAGRRALLPGGVVNTWRKVFDLVNRKLKAPIDERIAILSAFRGCALEGDTAVMLCDSAAIPKAIERLSAEDRRMICDSIGGKRLVYRVKRQN